ncbi:MAG: A/G-specific adenine glycosylase [Oscillospiraceae bacterium]|jgi:A/G-specific adenine glycosylase|nr:A/G-specific adenine glycosylase [Oscillospiraceae bacterium]
MDEITKNRIYENIAAPLYEWYEAAARDLPWRKDREPYHVWLSEIMLQQTRVEAVRAYYLRFLESLPTLASLTEADGGILLKLWQGLGYYNRARNLQKCAKMLVQEYDGRFPEDYEALLRLPGVGEYTAGAIASICFDKPTPAVDGNVLRVIARLMNDSRCVDDAAVKREVRERLARVYPQGKCGEFTQALMELGACVCVPNGAPKCHACPLGTLCLAFANGTQADLPVKAKKSPRKIEELTVFVFAHEGAIALQKREEKGVLHGLPELPNVKGHLDESQAIAAARGLEVEVAGIEKCIHRKHVFTHIEWHMRCYFVRAEACSGPFAWADSEALAKKYALPTAFQKLLDGIVV